MKTFGRILLVFNALWLISLSHSDPPPQLSSATKPGGRVEIGWPNGFPSFRLEASKALGPTASWQPVPETPTASTNGVTVSISAGETKQFFRLKEFSVGAQIIETSPADGESGVAVTRETILRFDQPLDSGIALDTSNFYAEFGGRRLLSRAELSSDRQTATLFYLENLPGSARIKVSFDARNLNGLASPIDPNQDSDGIFVLEFETAGISGLPNTGVIGHVFTSEPGPGGTNVPIQRAIVTVDGAEEALRAVTDDFGFFRLQPAPAGRFFVHVDGRTAIGSQWPRGAYYPFVGKAWEATPGQSNNPAGGNGVVFLPLIPADALQPISSTNETKITFPPSILATNPAFAGVSLTIPPNALFSENGARGGKVGIAPVPPDRLPQPLPPGLNLPLVITVQTDGPQNFDQPVPVRFPNLPDPVTGVKLAPGEKTVLWSFNHDTGRWEPQGTATISADGNFAETDPGVGIRQPGWNGVVPGTRAQNCIYGNCPPRQPNHCDDQELQTFFTASDCVFDAMITASGANLLPVEGCALSAVISSWRTARDCLFLDLDRCGPSAWANTKSFGYGCIPYAGGVINQARCAVSTTEEIEKLDKCRKQGLAIHATSALGSAATQAIENLSDEEAVGAVLNRLVTNVLGSPIWATLAADPGGANYSAFFNQLDAALQPSSEAGTQISAAERTSLLALARPGTVTLSDITALLDRFQQLASGGIKLPANRDSINQAYTDAINLVEGMQAKGWRTLLDGLFASAAAISELLEPARASGNSPSETDPIIFFPPGPHRYVIFNIETGFQQRGRLNSQGQLDNVILNPNSYYGITYYIPKSESGAPLIGKAFFKSAAAGQTTIVPLAPLATDHGADSDGDGLSDLAELVLGTSVHSADTDGDGVQDGQEVFAGSDPLDGAPVALGAIAGLNLGGSATSIALQNDLAALGVEKAVAFVNVRDPVKPLLVGTLTAPNTVLGVAFSRTMAAAACGSSGVTVFDISDPAKPAFSRQITGTAAQVIAGYAGRFYYGANRTLNIVDSVNPNDPRVEVVLSSNLNDLQGLDGFLYVLTSTALQIYGINGVVLMPRGSVSTAGGAAPLETGRKLFVGGGRAFIGGSEGWQLLDVHDPDAPTIISKPVARQSLIHDIAFDGNELVAMTSFAGPSSIAVSVFSTSDPTIVTNLLTSLDSVNIPRAAALHRGFALVADTAAGISTLNYVSRDTGTNPPSITLRGRFTVAAPPTQSSLEYFSVIADTADDVLVRNIEFYLDDQLVADNGSYPFEQELRAPQFTATKTSFTLKARAFDTAGNSAWSQTLTVGLAPDVAPPQLIAIEPAVNPIFRLGTTFPISATFSEPLAPATLSPGFTLINLGADQALGGGDDSVVAATVSSAGTNKYNLNPNAPLPLGTYAAKVGTNLTDLLGNHLAADSTWTIRVRSQLEFIGAGTNAAWSAKTAANWSSALNPTIDDFAHIAAPGSTVNASGLRAAFDLETESPVSFASGSSLQLGKQAIFGAPVTIIASTWQGGSVFLRGETQIGSLAIRDQDFNNEGHLELGPNASITLFNGGGSFIPTFIRNAPGATWEMIDSQIFIPNIASGPVDFENRGLFISGGTNRNAMIASHFINLGSVEVHSGLLDIHTPDTGHGPSQHLGSYRVDAGATLRLGYSEFGRGTHIFGPGDVVFDNGSFPGTYEADGKTTINGEITFSGAIRNSGPWNIAGASHATFSGLNPEVTGPFIVQGRSSLTVSVLPEMKISSLEVYSDLEVTSALVVSGPLQLNSVAQPNGTLASCRLLGSGRLRADGPLSFAGIVNSVGTGTLEIGGNATCALTSTLGLSGTELHILPGGIFDVTGARGVSLRTALINEGTLLKTGADTVSIGRGLQNRGTLQITGGTLQFLSLVDSSGLLSLAGGNLSIGSTVATPTELTITGGRLEGAGQVTCGSVTNASQVSPGSPIGLLDLQVGTHPLYSVYQQTGAGKLTIDLASATEYDRVNVSGRAVLDGTLELVPTANFDPPLGQEFTILTAATVEGTFATVPGADFKTGKRLDVVYEETDVKLKVVAAP